MNKYYTCILLFILLININAGDIANQQKKLVQLSGCMVNFSGIPLPFAHILVINSYRGTITDKAGQYSLVTRIGDTIMFSSLGYKQQYLVVPDTLSNSFLFNDVVLEQDTFMIGEIEIYPWKSYEEFKRAFLNLELPDDDMDRARRNIALIQTQIILDRTPGARANFQKILNEQYRRTFNRAMYPSYSILNPFAWADFFKALKRGDFKKYEQSDDS